MLASFAEIMCKLVLVFSPYLRGFRTLLSRTSQAWTGILCLAVHVCEQPRSGIYETKDLDKS